jgi:hypothetical protein
VVDSIIAGYRVTDAVVARYQRENPGAGSMSDPEAGVTVVFARPVQSIQATPARTFDSNKLPASTDDLDEIDRILAEGITEEN